MIEQVMNRIKRNGSTYRWRKLRQEILKRDNYICYYCGLPTANQVDHQSPVSKGGLDTPDNLVSACKNCNLSKNNKSTEQFLKDRRKKLKRMKISDFFEHDKTSPTPAMFLSPELVKTPFEKPDRN